MHASQTIRNHHFRNDRPALLTYGAARPISVRNFILLALAIVLAAGVTMLVISQASASEIAGGFVSAGMADGAIGVAALGSVLVSSFVAGFLVLSRRSLRHDDDSRSGSYSLHRPDRTH